jgi:GAF domain-containing protein
VTIFELDGQDLRAVAHWGPIPQDIGTHFPCSRGHVAGRTVIERKPIHVLDLQAETEEFPGGSAFAKRFGQRTTFGVPLLREGEAIGTIQLRRVEINPFTNEQMALLGTFAAQAVIAIENARLLNELRESLEQQTATSEVLGVISSSPGDLDPVFDAILTNATRICEAKFATMFLYEAGAFRVVGHKDVPRAYAERWSSNPVLVVADYPELPLARVEKTKEVQHIADLTQEPAYIECSSPPLVGLVDLAGARTLISVPMLKEKELVGALLSSARKSARLPPSKSNW